MLIETSLRETTLGELTAQAALAEAVGFDVISQPEIRADPFLALALMAPATHRVRLATSVAIAFARSPMVVAYLAHGLQEVSGGRFELGLGTQVRAHVERRFSAPWDPPGPRLREYILALRAIWECWQHGTPLEFRGRYYSFTLMTPEFSPGPSRFGAPPIQAAAVNPYNLQLAGELCDGLRVHPFSTPSYLRAVILPNLERGAARAGRSPLGCEVIGCGFVATGGSLEVVTAMREEARRRVAFYASTPAYRAVLEHHGWGELGGALRRLIARGQWEALASLVDDAVLEQFCVSGTYEVIAERLAERLAGLVDRISIPLPPDAASERDRLSRALAAIRDIPTRRSAPSAGSAAPA